MDEEKSYLSMEEIQGNIQHDTLLIDEDYDLEVIKTTTRYRALCIIRNILISLLLFMTIIDLVDYYSISGNIFFHAYIVGAILACTLSYSLALYSWYNNSIAYIDKCKVYTKVSMCMYWYGQMQRFDQLADWERDKIFENDIMPYAGLKKS